VEEVAAELGRNPAQVALPWLLAQPDVTVPLVGASRTEQLEDTVAAMDLQLSPEHLDRLDQVSQPFR
jgi:aryl-alcohol dehydrogenase-like predicted oxidoreductase